MNNPETQTQPIRPQTEDLTPNISDNLDFSSLGAQPINSYNRSTTQSHTPSPYESYIDDLTNSGTMIFESIILFNILMVILIILALISVIQLNSKFGKFLRLYEYNIDRYNYDERPESIHSSIPSRKNEQSEKADIDPVKSQSKDSLESDKKGSNSKPLAARKGLIATLGVIAIAWVAVLIYYIIAD